MPKFTIEQFSLLSQKFTEIKSKGSANWARNGQLLFNLLNEINPEAANAIRGNITCDPFYIDQNIPSFYGALMNMMEEK
jgi:hypothetical protein